MNVHNSFFLVLLKKEFPSHSKKERVHHRQLTPIYSNIYRKELFNKPISAQLHVVLERCYEELNFFPPQVLTRLFPFSTPKGPVANYRFFELTTYNTAFLELAQEGLPSEKLKKIGYYLQSSLVELIEVYDPRTSSLERIELEALTIPKPPELDLNMEYLRFDKIYQRIQHIRPDESIDSLLRLAYLSYKLGYYYEAYNLYVRIADKSQDEEKELSYFISQYNLVRLSHPIKVYYEGEDKEDILARIQAIKLDEIVMDMEDELSRYLGTYIEKEEFLKQAYVRMMDAFANLRLGRNAEAFFTEFMSIHLFLTKNNLLYDSLSDFRVLANYFIEGVILLLAAKSPYPNYSSYLTQVDDYMLDIFVQYAKPEELMRWFQEYGLRKQEIKYFFPQHNPEENFYQKVVNFLSNGKETNDLLTWQHKNRLYAHIDRYYYTFANLLIILAHLEVERGTLKKITSLLPTYLANLPQSPFLQKIILGHLGYFLFRRGTWMAQEDLVLLLKLTINEDRFGKKEFIPAICDTLLAKDPGFRLQDEEFTQKIIDKYKQKLTNSFLGNHTDFSPLIHYYPFIDESKKVALQELLKDILEKAFQPKLFYDAVTSQVLSPNLFWQKFTESATRYHYENEHKEEYIDERTVRMIIDLSVEFDLEIDYQSREKFENISPYLYWLLNYDDYDYGQFDPTWLLNDHSTHQIERFKTIPEIGLRIAQLLKENYHEALAKIYFTHFVETDSLPTRKDKVSYEKILAELKEKHPPQQMEDIQADYKTPDKKDIVGQWDDQEPVEDIIKKLKENK